MHRDRSVVFEIASKYCISNSFVDHNGHSISSEGFLPHSSRYNGHLRMGKTRDLFKKIRDNKGTFHAKMGSIKDRNGMDLTEAEDIKKRWQEYTEELYKKRPR